MKRLPVPHLGRPGEFEGDGLDALSPEVGEESQGVAPGVIRVVLSGEDRGEVLMEDPELGRQNVKIFLPELFARGEKIGGYMVGGGQDDTLGRSRGTCHERLIGRGLGILDRPGPSAGRGRGLGKKSALDPELRIEHDHVDVFHLTVVGVFDPALPGEPLGLTQTQKSRGPVAGPGVMGWVDEALHHPGGEIEPLLPVAGETAKRLAQHMGGEVLDPDSRKDEKSGVVDQPGAVELLLLRRPSHPAVADLDLGGRSGKGESGHRLRSNPGDVFDPAAGKPLVAQGMMLPDQGVPEILLPGPGLHRYDGDLPQILEGSQSHLPFTDDLF